MLRTLEEKVLQSIYDGQNMLSECHRSSVSRRSRDVCMKHVEAVSETLSRIIHYLCMVLVTHVQRLVAEMDGKAA